MPSYVEYNLKAEFEDCDECVIYSLTRCIDSNEVYYTTEALSTGISTNVDKVVEISEYEGCYLVEVYDGEDTVVPEEVTITDDFDDCNACAPVGCHIQNNSGTPEVSFDGMSWTAISTSYDVHYHLPAPYPPLGSGCAGDYVASASWRTVPSLGWAGYAVPPPGPCVTGAEIQLRSDPTTFGLDAGISCFWVIILDSSYSFIKLYGSTPVGSYFPAPSDDPSNAPSNVFVP